MKNWSQKHKDSEYVTINNGVIFLKQKNYAKWRLAVPKLTGQLVNETHILMGHPGRYKILHALKETHTFKNMHKLTASILKRCNLCQ